MFSGGWRVLEVECAMVGGGGLGGGGGLVNAFFPFLILKEYMKHR